MRETTKDSPMDRGEVILRGRCHLCGVEGDTVALLKADPPNQLCPHCAIEYNEMAAAMDEEDLP